MSHKIIFMGTPDFAVASLKEILHNNIDVAAVVTAPDRPSGRGQKIRSSAVKVYAEENNIPVLQPEKLKNPDFIEQLKDYNADLFVVVAFRMLPEVVWSLPKFGTINLHGSLLPKYRGAAPINWAVINGEKETGVTTFFIEKEIDTGLIIDNASLQINDNDTAGTIHDKLMVLGANLLAKTIHNIFDQNIQTKAQPETGIIHAPKIFKADCKLDWNDNTTNLFNKIRGLSPYPTAFTVIEKEDQSKSLKIFNVDKEIDNKNNSHLITISDHKLKFGTNDGWIIINELQLEGKKRMQTKDFLSGFNILEWHLGKG